MALRVIKEAVGIQAVMAMEPPGIEVKVLAAALSGNHHHAAGGLAELGLIIRSEDLDLAYGIGVDGNLLRLLIGARDRRAVNRHIFHGDARPIDLIRTDGAEVTHLVGAAGLRHSGNQLRQIVDVTPIQCQVAQLFTNYRLRPLAGISL